MNPQLKEVVFHDRAEALSFIEAENQLLESLDTSKNTSGRQFIAKESEYKGFDYYIVRHVNDYNLGTFHLCGYVALNESVNTLLQSLFQLLNKNYKNIISCHGGLTYEGENFINNQKGKLMIGFDCGHSGDIFSMYNFKLAEITSGNAKESYKTFYYVEDNCRSIIDQLIKISTLYQDYKNGAQPALEEIKNLLAY